MIRKEGYCVPGLSTQEIRETALMCRHTLRIKRGVRAVDIIEMVLPEVLDGFEYEIISRHELGDHHARTYPDRNLIQIREDVYNNACNLNRATVNQCGRDNFTLAHELGHLFLHKGAIGLARGNINRPHERYKDSEWQADQFAAEFLMPYDQIHVGMTAESIQKMFLVSRAAAQNRLSYISRKTS